MTHSLSFCLTPRERANMISTSVYLCGQLGTASHPQHDLWSNRSSTVVSVTPQLIWLNMAEVCPHVSVYKYTVLLPLPLLHISPIWSNMVVYDHGEWLGRHLELFICHLLISINCLTTDFNWIWIIDWIYFHCPTNCFKSNFFCHIQQV